MLTGQELGQAIEAARIKKGISKKKLADDFGVAPPSVQGWVKFGRIDKSKLMELIVYFSDVVEAEHWGLTGKIKQLLKGPLAPWAPREPDPVTLYLGPGTGIGKTHIGSFVDALNPENRALKLGERILEGTRRGNIKDDDLKALESLVKFFEASDRSRSN